MQTEQQCLHWAKGEVNGNLNGVQFPRELRIHFMQPVSGTVGLSEHKAHSISLDIKSNQKQTLCVIFGQLTYAHFALLQTLLQRSKKRNITKQTEPSNKMRNVIFPNEKIPSRIKNFHNYPKLNAKNGGQLNTNENEKKLGVLMLKSKKKARKKQK